MNKNILKTTGSRDLEAASKELLILSEAKLIALTGNKKNRRDSGRRGQEMGVCKMQNYISAQAERRMSVD